MYGLKTDLKRHKLISPQNNLMVAAMPLDELIIQIFCLIDDVYKKEWVRLFGSAHHTQDDQE